MSNVPTPSKEHEASPVQQNGGRDGILDEKTMQLSFGADKKFICATMQIYRRDAPGISARCHDAAEKNDNEALAHAAHALKGMTAYFSRGELYQACLDLEFLGKANGLPEQSQQAFALCSAIHDNMALLDAAMQRYMLGTADSHEA